MRQALGAVPGRVRWMVLGDTARLIAMGALAGGLGALPLSGTMVQLLYGISPTDPLTFAGAIGVIVLVGLLSGSVAARRVTATMPADALRRL